MERLTISLEQHQYDELVKEAERRDVSKSAVAREIFENWFTTSPDSHNAGGSGEGAVNSASQDVVSRLDELEARVAALEGEPEPPPPDHAPGVRDDGRPDAENRVETADSDGAIGRGGAASHATDPESEPTAAAEPAGEQADQSPSEETAGSTGASAPPVDAGLEERARWALQESGQDVPPDRVEALAAVLTYARDHDGITMREALEHVMLEHPAGYATDAAEEYLAGERDRFRGGWWRTFITDALEVLPEIEAPPRGASKWEFTDTEAADE